jgi:hypothetical protein
MYLNLGGRLVNLGYYKCINRVEYRSSVTAIHQSKFQQLAHPQYRTLVITTNQSEFQQLVHGQY